MNNLKMVFASQSQPYFSVWRLVKGILRWVPFVQYQLPIHIKLYRIIPGDPQLIGARYQYALAFCHRKELGELPASLPDPSPPGIVELIYLLCLYRWLRLQSG